MWPFNRKRNRIVIDSNTASTVGLRNIQIGNVAGGIVNASGLALFLYVCVSHSLNVGYLILFGISSLIIISSHVGAAALKRLEVSCRKPELLASGKLGKFHLKINTKIPRKDIEIFAISGSLKNMQTFDFDALSANEIAIDIIELQRGVYSAPKIIIQTRRPIGLMRCFVRVCPKEEVIVYPSPEENAPSFRTGGLSQGNQTPGFPSISGQPSGLKNYQSGDPLKLFSWKTFAKTDANLLATKTPEMDVSESDISLTLTDAMQCGEIEAALSRLTAWVFEAQAEGAPYSLNLADVTIPPGKGPNHLAACLLEMARYRSGAPA